MHEEFELKAISEGAIAHALEKAEHYRLLNEPQQAESICLDILKTDPDNEQVLVLLILAMTDQVGAHDSPSLSRMNEYLAQLSDEYKKAYYAGIVAERRARAFLKRGGIASTFAYDGLRKAMECYEQAEALRPPDTDDPQLRWNSCVRALRQWRLNPRQEEDHVQFQE